MFLFTSTVIFISAVVYQCHAEQKLECPYGSNRKDQERVWCKMDTDNPNCCTGFSFQSGNNELDGGRLSVTENNSAFVVSVKSLSQGGWSLLVWPHEQRRQKRHQEHHQTGRERDPLFDPFRLGNPALCALRPAPAGGDIDSCVLQLEKSE
ncbi:hypothetical protein QTP86_018768, partial [Hemibagrus guttatus]